MKLKYFCLVIIIIICFEDINTKPLSEPFDLVVSPAGGEPVLRKKTLYRKTITHKKIKKLRTTEHVEKLPTKQKSPNYFSYFVFIPLVMFIFIMTIISIIGFIVLMLNSFGALKKQGNQTPSLNSELVKNNLTNEELTEIMKLKQLIRNRIKSNYNAAPGFNIF
jgi:hypothetical protein